MKPLTLVLLSAATGFVAPAWPDSAKYPPLDEYMMTSEAEIALAKSAAPPTVSDRATIKVLTKAGYKTVKTGDNGCACIVMRGWSGVRFVPADGRTVAYDAKLRAPICFDPIAARTILPQEELRADLGLKVVAPDTIASEVAMAYVTGKLPQMEGVSFGYMWSADQNVGPDGKWHPHMMIYAPYYRNEMLGGHGPASGLPSVVVDEGSPFALIVVAVDDELAIPADAKSQDAAGKHH